MSSHRRKLAGYRRCTAVTGVHPSQTNPSNPSSLQERRKETEGNWEEDSIPPFLSPFSSSFPVFPYSLPPLLASTGLINRPTARGSKQRCKLPSGSKTNPKPTLLRSIDCKFPKLEILLKILTGRSPRRAGSCAVERPGSPWLRQITAHSVQTKQGRLIRGQTWSA